VELLALDREHRRDADVLLQREHDVAVDRDANVFRLRAVAGVDHVDEAEVYPAGLPVWIEDRLPAEPVE
jgi:hypothetical protein